MKLRRKVKSDLDAPCFRTTTGRLHKSDFARRFLCAGIFLFFIYQNAGAQLQLRCENLGASGGVVSSSEFTLLEIVGQSYPIETAANADFILHPGFIPCFLFETTTGVEEQLDSTEIPAAFALWQNFPNPFNPSTVIIFQLPVNSRVKLQVFDVNGREVATLVDGEMTVGKHAVAFSPSHSSSGVYFYKLTAGKFSQTRKAVLMK
jgi:hypothetical protein